MKILAFLIVVPVLVVAVIYIRKGIEDGFGNAWTWLVGLVIGIVGAVSALWDKVQGLLP